MLSLILFQGNEEVTQRGKNFFLFLFRNGLNRSNNRICVCARTHTCARMCMLIKTKTKPNCWWLFFSCHKCKGLAIHVQWRGSAQIAGHLPWTSKCSHGPVGAETWTMQRPLSLVMGADVVALEQERRSPKCSSWKGHCHTAVVITSLCIKRVWCFLPEGSYTVNKVKPIIINGQLGQVLNKSIQMDLNHSV